MRIIKTKSGQLSLTLDLSERTKMFYAIMGFCESEGVEIQRVPLKTKPDATRHLYYSVLDDLLTKKNYYLFHNVLKKITITRSESIALVWLLSDAIDMSEQELKSQLYQKLI